MPLRGGKALTGSKGYGVFLRLAKFPPSPWKDFRDRLAGEILSRGGQFAAKGGELRNLLEWGINNYPQILIPLPDSLPPRLCVLRVRLFMLILSGIEEVVSRILSYRPPFF